MLREHKLQLCEIDTINHSILEMKRLRAKESRNGPKNIEVKIGEQPDFRTQALNQNTMTASQIQFNARYSCKRKQ